jgi:hypothetical protein
MGGTCSTHVRDEKYIQNLLGKLGGGREHLEDVGVKGG